MNSSSPPVVSVCIAHFNGIELINACIDSVRQQDCDFDVEIIVHDDASTDDSVQYVREHHPDVRLIESAENVGFCVANNRMAAVATGEFLLLLNNDAELFPDALRTLYLAAREHPDGAVLGLPQFDRATGELVDRGCWVDPFLNPIPTLEPRQDDVAMVIGACMWVPKAVWDALGGFPEWFGSIGEDLYLCMVARLGGYPVRVPDKSGYRHRIGASFGGGKVADGRLYSTFRRRALSERNKTFVMAIAFPAPSMQVMLPLHLTLLLLEGVLLSMLKLDSRYLWQIYLPVLGALIRHHKEWRIERCKAQKERLLAQGKFFAVFDWVPYKLRMLVQHGLPKLK